MVAILVNNFTGRMAHREAISVTYGNEKIPGVIPASSIIPRRPEQDLHISLAVFMGRAESYRRDFTNVDERRGAGLGPQGRLCCLAC
jgi:hypothetical protein